jgi:hypothetical protein
MRILNKKTLNLQASVVFNLQKFLEALSPELNHWQIQEIKEMLKKLQSTRFFRR